MKEKYDYRFFFILMLGLTLLGAAAALVSPLMLQAWAQDEAGFTKYRILLLLLPVNYFGYRLLNRELRIRSEILQRENAEEQIYGSMADINIVARGASRILEAVNDIARTMLMAFTVLACVETGKSPVLLVLTTVLCPMYFSHLTAVTRANLNRQGILLEKP